MTGQIYFCTGTFSFRNEKESGSTTSSGATA